MHNEDREFEEPEKKIRISKSNDMPCKSFLMLYFTFEVTTWEQMSEMFALWQDKNFIHKTEMCQFFSPA